MSAGLKVPKSAAVKIKYRFIRRLKGTEGRGGQVMEWGVNSSKNGPGTCQWINNLLLTALPHSHREILKYSLKRGILSWINTSQNPIQSVACRHIEHAKQKEMSGVDAPTFYHRKTLGVLLMLGQT